jgi:hypothetical protein
MFTTNYRGSIAQKAVSIISLFVLVLGVFPAAAFADISLDSVSPAGTTVMPGAQVTFTVQGDTSPNNPGSDNDWLSTRVTIDIPNTSNDITSCVNSPNHSNGAANNISAQVTLTAPSSAGNYQVIAKAYRQSNCGNERASKSTTLTVAAPSTNITNIDLNGGNSVTVTPSTSVTVTVTASLANGAKWRGTSYRFESGSYLCVNTPDNDANGSHTETFTVTVPSSIGTYDFDVRTYDASDCEDGNGSVDSSDTDHTDSDALDNGVVVQNPPSTTTITGATFNGGSTVTVEPGESITIVVTTTLSGDNDWESTSWNIANDGDSEACENTSDATSAGTYTRTFTITAPDSEGTYDITFYAFGKTGNDDDDDCDTSADDSLTLNNVIIVEEEEITPPDADGDGVSDSVDNCPSIANQNQLNNDGDGLGDVCDPTPNGDTCPQGQTGTPPNCITPEPEACPQGTTGTPPTCTPITPEVCPEGTTGTPPACLPIEVPQCAENQHGTYPDCVDNEITSTPEPEEAPKKQNRGHVDPVCNNNEDDDNDGLYDVNDPDCADANGNSESPAIGGTSEGDVLGASTCSAIIDSYIGLSGITADPAAVKVLQAFLNKELGLTLEVNGEYDAATIEAVKAFQAKYSLDVLSPWGINDATGIVYKTTQRMINKIACPTLDIPMPELN